jgi:hypothetical protein
LKEEDIIQKARPVVMEKKRRSPLAEVELEVADTP